MNDKIANIHAHEILDSRGNPTISVHVTLRSGAFGIASVPSGASTGIHEAHELRDGDKKRYRGLGVRKAIQGIEKKILPALLGVPVHDQRGIDDAMRVIDGTPRKHVLGANAILGVSLAVARAGAKSLHLPLYSYIREVFGLSYRGYHLPTPMFNLINGGRHADSTLDVQEFLIIPHGLPSFSRKLQAGSEIFHALGDVLHRMKRDTDIGNEGGYGLDALSHEEAFDALVVAVKNAKYRLRSQISFGIDAAASEIFNARTEKYTLSLEKKQYSAEELIRQYEHWAAKYPLFSLEDGLAEDDWLNWKTLTARMGKHTLLIGDDLFVTNTERIQMGIPKGVANALLVKPNQIGSLSETLDAILLAQKHRYRIVLSHRSGETPDATIADIAVAVNAEYIKSGAPSRSERLAKYNRLLEIEEELHSR